MMKINKIVRLIVVGVFCCSTTSLFSQTLKNIFSEPDSALIYLGVDFSKSKLIGEGNATEIRNKFYGSINQLVVAEPKKYVLTTAFRKNAVDFELDAVNKSNATADTSQIISAKDADFKRFKESDITAIVNSLDFSGKKGTAVLFVMEAMQKYGNKPEAAVWVTFIDLDAKKVLMTERREVRGKGGFGFRNYWGSTIKSLIDEIKEYKYYEWKTKFAK